MKLGIGSYAYAWNIGVPGLIPEHPMDVFEFVKTASVQGAQVVQIGDNLPLHKLKPTVMESLVQVCRELKVAVEVGTRGLHTKRLKRYFEIAQQFQSPFLRLVVDDKGFEPTVKEVVGEIRSLLPVIKETGIILAIENHDRFKARQLAGIIESTDPQLVGVCLDTANSLGAGEGIEEVMQHLAPYTVNLHVKDFAVSRVPSNMGFTVNGCPAGRGIIDIPGLLERLSKNQNFYSVTLELWSDLMDDLPQTIAREHRWVAKSMNYLSDVVSDFQSA